tara:strand:- start:821 stop:1567 length:747 start_codon:yes stop_codon:yes gene_type:complete
MIGPVPIKLKKRQRAVFKGLTIHVCPDPEGRLALIVVEGPPGTDEDTFDDTAYEAVQSTLREMTYIADVPLAIAHSFILGVPSGVIRLKFPKPSKEVEFESLNILLKEPLNEELEEAKALYWEALSTSDPFHQFLTLWRIYERITSARQHWRKINKCADKKIVEEKMPNTWVWSDKVGLSFTQVRQHLEKPYRDAIAHADAKRTRPRTSFRASDLKDVAVQISTVRFIARTVIRNFEATLLSGPQKTP